MKIIIKMGGCFAILREGLGVGLAMLWKEDIDMILLVIDIVIYREKRDNFNLMVFIVMLKPLCEFHLGIYSVNFIEEKI